MNRVHATGGLAVLAGLLLIAAGPRAGAAEHQVVITKMKFGPPPANLHVGDVIVWRNDDIFRHTATARDKGFDVDLPARAEKRMTIERAGAVEFYCRFHPAMKGRLTVQP